MKDLILISPLIIVWIVAIYIMATQKPEKVCVPISEAKFAVIEIDQKNLIFTN